MQKPYGKMYDTEYFFRWGAMDRGCGLRIQYLLKLGHRFNAIPLKILTDFCETWQGNYKICVELQESRNNQEFFF